MTTARVVSILMLARTINLVAQSTLIGTVGDSSGKHMIENAQVAIPALNRSVRSSADGIYRFDSLQLGTYLVTVRAIGYSSWADTVAITATDGTMHDFTLMPVTTLLPPVVTTSPKVKYVSPRLQGFEDRRAMGFGHFIAEAELRKRDNSKLSDVLPAHLPGMIILRGSRGATAVSTRTGTASCPATVYVDGLLVYRRGMTGARPPDIDDFSVDQLAGVEYYAGEADAPMKYHNEAACGIVMFWTREK